MRKRLWWVVAIVVILGAPVAWYLGSPLFINRTVDEPFPGSFPASAGATIPEGMTRQQVEDTMMQASKRSATAAESMATGTAAVVARGTFRGADDFHKGEGTATVSRVDKDLVLRLDPFRVTNGPDLHVILTKHPTPKSRADVDEGYVEVAKLKGNIGSQNYALPQDVSLTDYRTVVIYCKPFHVVFATAPLQAAQ